MNDFLDISWFSWTLSRQHNTAEAVKLSNGLVFVLKLQYTYWENNNFVEVVPFVSPSDSLFRAISQNKPGLMVVI